MLLSTAVMLVAGLAGAARASATEPVFDTAYDTRLGNILRLTLSSTADDYAALEGLTTSAKAGDRTSSRVLGQLGRLRAEIGNAPPLRRISIPFSRTNVWRVYFYTGAGEWVQPFTYPYGSTGIYTWYWSGFASGSHPCSVSESTPVGEDFHNLYGGTCFREFDENYNETSGTSEMLGVLRFHPYGQMVSWNGCVYAVAPYDYRPSVCIARIITDHQLWEMIHPLGNAKIYASQAYDASVGYQWWEPSWNPGSAPSSQSTSLSAGRARLDDADNQLLRAWLNHLFDPDNYRPPLPVNQTMGDCSRQPNNLAPDECEQARR